MNLFGWTIFIVAVVLYVRYGAGIRARIARFVLPASGPGFNPKRFVATLAIAAILGVCSRFVVGSILPINAAQYLTNLSAGPDGATADLAGGGTVTVPAGALEKPATISLQKRAAAENLPPGALYVYEMSPVDATLQQPIELNMPIPEGQNVSVFVTVNGQSRVLPATVKGQTARVSITSFDFNQPGAVNVGP